MGANREKSVVFAEQEYSGRQFPNVLAADNYGELLTIAQNIEKLDY